MKGHHTHLFIAIATLTSSFSTPAVHAQGYGYTPAPSPGATPTATPSGNPGTVGQYTYKTSQGPYGEYVTDYQGRAIYAFAADTAYSSISTCYNQCANAWPPVTIPNGQTPSGSGAVTQGSLGTLTRTDGTYQVTYYGYPLYYYAEDQGSNDYKGHKLDEYGGIWYLLTSAGKFVP